MRTQISKVAKSLNVGVNTAVEFLRKHNIEVDEGNPNARIDSDAVELLTREFSKDKDAKANAQAFIKNRREEKKEKKDRNSGEDKSKSATGLKILGKIDLSNGKGNNQKSAGAAVDNSKPESRQPKAAETKPEPKPEQKASVMPVQPKPEQPKPEQKPAVPIADKAPKQNQEANKQANVKPANDKPATEKKVQPQSSEVQKNNTPKEATSQAAAAPADESNKPFRYAPTQGPELKVLGKIDLSAINQSTRPKKKSKSERRNENGDRKKRKRIGQQKVDIEKAGQQAGAEERKKKQDDRNRGNGGGGNNGHRGNNNGGNNNGGGGNGDRNHRRDRDRRGNNRQEVSTEDVQKQVKETLARLTNKKTNKSVKFRKEKREEMHHRELENARREEAESRILKITEFVTANDLANLMDVQVNQVIATCMNLGVMVSINQRLDAETINIVAEEFGFETEFVSADLTEAIETPEDKEEDLQPRPPIVTVMGHVDHGKTSLLDYIRKANVIAGEAGGITQHIGAYNVTLSNGRHITFLDTPGHEAFTAMRARGAKVTDLAIIIVAADDDVMPQTIEAINHASAAGVPMVFAINKIDKPAANPDKIKEQLGAMNYLVEEWGGKYQSQDISAKKGIGVEELMEKVLLEAEMLDLKANPDRAAVGSVIESSLDKGRGYVATVLVQNGTLRVGDVILAGTNYGKVKAMFNERNQRVKEAGPSTPVLILGLNGAPQAGDAFNVMETEQEAREIASKREQLQRELSMRTKKRPGLEELGRRRALNDFHELNLVVKGDVDGSVEALSDSLLKLSTPEIQVNVLHKGVGAISESDVTLAAASDAIIIGFQVRPSGAARKEAEKEGVEIRLYSVIYKAIEEVKDAMEGLLAPEIKEEIIGNAEVLQTYKISKVGTIAGAIVRDGKIKRTSKVRVIRDGIVIYTGELGSLKRFKDDAKEVLTGYDCGLSVQGYNDIREGDLIEAYEEVEVKKTL